MIRHSHRTATPPPPRIPVRDVFLAMGEELTVLQPGTLEVVEAYFEALSSQAEGPGPFTISRQTVRADGQDDSGGEPIQAVKLSSAERDTFIKVRRGWTQACCAQPFLVC